MRWWGSIKKLSALDGYNRWARTYHREANPIKKMSDEFVSESLPALKGKSVLDAGCGTGKFCVMAVEQGASLVKGIDLSPLMIEEAMKNCPNATFECSDLSSANIEKYDVIICALVLGHIEKIEPVLTKLIASLKPAGKFIVSDFHPYQTLMRAKRTFRNSGKTFEVAHTLHRLDEYFSILKNTGVHINDFREPLYKEKPVIFGISGTKS